MEIDLSYMTEKFEKRLDHREDRYDRERSKKEKRSDDYKTLEEVFDKPTLMTIYHLMNTGILSSLAGILNAGKEARVYLGYTPSEEEVAVKIYLTSSAEFKKGMMMYIDGDPRFSHVKRDTRSLIYTWAMKEYRNLKGAYDAGVRVPKPIKVLKNVLVMEFIGREESPASLLRENPPKDIGRVYASLMRYARALYGKAGLVHSDLSEYNVMIYKGKPIIFDMAQSVSIDHPRAKEFLLRDLTNLEKYFIHMNVETKSLDEAYRYVTGEYLRVA